MVVLGSFGLVGVGDDGVDGQVVLFQVVVCFGAAYLDPVFFRAKTCDVLPVLSKELDEQVLVFRVKPLFSLRCLAPSLFGSECKI